MISIDELRGQRPKIVCLGSHPGIIQSVIDYDYLCGRDATSITAVISKNHKWERYFWGENEIEIPVFSDLAAVPDDKRESINYFLNVQSGRRVLESTKRALELLNGLQGGVIFAEQVPEIHALELSKLADARHVLIAGPASVGLLIPGTIKLGAIGGTMHQQIVAARIMKGGDTAVISTSGGMVNELIHTVTSAGLGVSFALALGGDRFPITSPGKAFMLAEADPQTKQIIYFGELGGIDEYEIAQLIKDGKVTKKVVAYIAGTVAELFETPPQFGHAKAMAQTADETASAKKEALRGVDVTVLDTFGDLPTALAKDGNGDRLPVGASDPSRSIGPRRKHLIASHISGEKHHEVQLLGSELIEMVERHSLASLLLSMLLGQEVSSPQLITFTDYVLRLLSDHGPYVAGAANTIMSARAGKDLVSSLASGLLTIGPRFGGVINESAKHWLRGVGEGLEPRDFVDTFGEYGGIIPGIGHKKYRVDLPDPRVAALRKLVDGSSHKYLDFALGVQAVTTAKKGTLILNVDGAIAAIFLDLLESELGYDQRQLRELADIEFFNALFVLSRSIGFTAHYLDQRRHDEGLLRLSDEEITYLG
jgi:ATP citrate (pro-S)-lyase